MLDRIGQDFVEYQPERGGNTRRHLDLIDADADGVTELDPVEKLVEADGERTAGDMVPVRLEAHVTELGTLELWCVARDGRGRWKLEYSVRERD